MTDKPKYKSFPLDGSDPINMTLEFQGEIEKLSLSGNNSDKKSNRTCEWCGHNDWELNSAVMTNTIFDVGKDVHSHDYVRPVFVMGCVHCGNTKFFHTKAYGYATKGGIEGG